MTVPKKRGARNKEQIIGATIKILKEVNYSSLTVEGVAAKAGVGKATIYRWWKHKSELVFDAFIAETESLFTLDDKKTIEENFVQQLLTLTEVLKSGVGRAMLTVIAEEKEVAATFLSAYLQPRRAKTEQMLHKGIKKGEIVENFNVETVLDMLYGPIYFRFILFNQVPDETYVEKLVKQVMKGIQKSPTAKLDR